MSKKIKTVPIPGLNWEKTAILAWEAIERVRDLHEPVPCTEDADCCTICDYCSQVYPCDTIKTLNGEQL